LQNAREIVNWSFLSDTKIGDVSDVYNINNNFFAVAAIRDMKKKGTPKMQDVREAIETELKTIKKLELVQTAITNELNNENSIQQVAEKYQVSFMDSIKLTFGGESYQNRGIENAAIGKIFTLPLNKPTVVVGKNNVYAVSIYEIDEPAEPSPNFTMEKSSLKNVVAGRGRTENTILDGLKDKATVLDQRYLYYTR
jgi:peptidyl-prolyl cis-trans isomerase D